MSKYTVRHKMSKYNGLDYFWAYKYRFWMRGDAHGNGYKGTPIRTARKVIHAWFKLEHLPLSGETKRHDEIINAVFGMNDYVQPMVYCDNDCTYPHEVHMERR
jgi:hypothetical protein